VILPPRIGFYIVVEVAGSISMAKEGKKGSGFQSSAGLIRYFDNEDEKALKLSPYVVLGLAVAVMLIVSLAKVIWPV
jgi:preprotein translocase subunit Sec61beta